LRAIASMVTLTVAAATLTPAGPSGAASTRFGRGPGAAASPTADFNGDGFADLAVGVPGESVGTATQAGAVSVLYGSATGLTSSGNQFWNQNASGIPDSAETGDELGFAGATGDVNGDGFADLAIGVPGEDLSGVTDAGAVEVLLGSSAGLTATGSALWSEGTAGVPGSLASGDQFGASLAVSDLNGDGFADLAIGAPGRAVSGRSLAGAAIVLYGSSTGLTATGSQMWTQDTAGVPNAAETDDHFAFALAAADLNRDGFADLAAGVPGENSGGGAHPDGGAAEVIYGSASGLVASGSQVWSQDSAGVPDSTEAQDDFGYSLAAGDFNGDGVADLALGVPFEDVGSIRDGGAADVLPGSAAGLTSTKSQQWTQDSSGIAGSVQAYDSFGFSLAGGNFDGDGFADLAAGVPGEGTSGHGNAGAVNVLYGSSSGLASARNQLWSQDSSGIAGSAETGDEFGFAVAAGQVGNGGQDDLFVGVPGESIGSVVGAGAAHAIYGSSSGLTATANQLWEQNSSGVADSCEAGDQFGFGLASGSGG
jgi:hypothetical protein